MFEQVVQVGDRLAALVHALDPDRVAGPDAERLWGALDRVERLAAAGKTLLARRVADQHRPDRSGARTPAEALARRAGTTVGAAQDALDTSARLAGQPRLAAAVRRGELSAAQAGLVSAAAADPAAGPRLLELAGSASLAGLREECARVRAGADPDPEGRNRRLHQGRRLRRHTDAEGGWNLLAHGTPQAGAVVNAALDPILDELFRAARREGRREPLQAYAFDALIELARRAAGDPPPSGAAAGGPSGDAPSASPAPPPGDPNPTADPDDADPDDADPDDADPDTAAPAPAAPEPVVPDPAAPEPVVQDPIDPGAAAAPEPVAPVPARPQPVAPEPVVPGAREPGAGEPGVRPRPGNPRFLALLRVDLEALHRGAVAGDELCEITGVGPVPVPVARGLFGDAVLKLVITRGVDVCHVTHLGRGPTAAQKVALAWTSPGCTVEGCYRSRVEYDHRADYARTRHTRLDELDPLCHHHRALKTRHGWALVAGTGKRAMVPRDDARHPRHQRHQPAAS